MNLDLLLLENNDRHSIRRADLPPSINPIRKSALEIDTSLQSGDLDSDALMRSFLQKNNDILSTDSSIFTGANRRFFDDHPIGSSDSSDDWVGYDYNDEYPTEGLGNEIDHLTRGLAQDLAALQKLSQELSHRNGPALLDKSQLKTSQAPSGSKMDFEQLAFGGERRKR